MADGIEMERQKSLCLRVVKAYAHERSQVRANRKHKGFHKINAVKMEFSLTINQKQIHENFPVLDIKDAAIIDFLTRFSHAKKIKKRIIGTDIYYWFDYGKIASENPLLKLDRESIRKRVRNICKLGILNAHPDNQGGEVYFAFGDNYEKTHRADLPEVEAQTSGKQSRTHRAENPELLAKHRANNPDNHNNHSNHNNQPSSEPEKAAADTAEFIIKTTTEFPDVTLVELKTLEAKTENPTPVPPPPAPPAESSPRRYDSFDIDTDAEKLKEDHLCRDRFGRDLRIGFEKATADFPVYVDRFVENQKAETFNYPNTKEFRRHFFNWIPKVYGIAQPGNQGPTRNGKANLNHLGKDAAQFAWPQKF